MNEIPLDYRTYLKQHYASVIRAAMEHVASGTRFVDLAVIVAGLDLKVDVRADHVAPLAQIVSEEGPAWAASEGVRSHSAKEVTDGQTI